MSGVHVCPGKMYGYSIPGLVTCESAQICVYHFRQVFGLRVRQAPADRPILRYVNYPTKLTCTYSTERHLLRLRQVIRNGMMTYLYQQLISESLPSE